MINNAAKKKFDPVKSMEIATALAFGLVLTVFILGFVPVSFPAITRKVVELARRTGVDSCTVGTVRVALWKGITLHHVGFVNKIGPDRRMRVQAKTITLRGNLAAAFLKFKKMDRSVFAPAASAKGPTRTFRQWCGMFAGMGRGISFSGAEFVIVENSRPVINGSDVSIDLSFSEKGKGDFDGTFSSSLLKPAGFPPLRQVSGAFSYAAADLSLARCKGRFCDGKIRCDARFNLARRALAGVTFTMNSFDFDEWYKFADSSGGRLSGRADCHLALDSSALAVDSLRGKGSFLVSRMDIRGFPFQNTLVSMLAYPGLAHLRFRKFKAEGTIKPKGVIATEATGEGDSLGVKASGWFSTRGRLDQKLLCTVARIAVPTLSDFARKTLEETKDGGRVLRLRVSGDVDNPTIVIDSKAILQKAVQNMFEEVKNNLQKWLK
jgi:hypothetical protein